MFSYFRQLFLKFKFLIFHIITDNDSNFVVNGFVHFGQNDGLGCSDYDKTEHSCFPNHRFQKNLIYRVLLILLAHPFGVGPIPRPQEGQSSTGQQKKSIRSDGKQCESKRFCQCLPKFKPKIDWRNVFRVFTSGFILVTSASAVGTFIIFFLVNNVIGFFLGWRFEDNLITFWKVDNFFFKPDLRSGRCMWNGTTCVLAGTRFWFLFISWRILCNLTKKK